MQKISIAVMRRLARQPGYIGFTSKSGKPCVERGPWQEYRVTKQEDAQA